MTLVEMKPYIEGKQFTGTATPYRSTPADIECWEELMGKNPIALAYLNAYDVPGKFFTHHPAIAQVVPKQKQEEMFYTIKAGMHSPVVPARCLYLFNKAYYQYGMCNLIFKLLPSKYEQVLFSEGYLAGGFTVRDVIKTFYDKNYEPFGDGRYAVKTADGYELYIESNDMVAAVPTPIAEALTQVDIQNISVDKVGLKTGDVYIRSMCGFVGGTSSIYDLRRVI